MKNQCRIISNEQLDVLYEVEKFLLEVSDNDEPLEKLSQTIRELDPSSGFNKGIENEKGEET